MCDVCRKLYEKPIFEGMITDKRIQEGKEWVFRGDVCSHKCMIEWLKKAIRLMAGCDDPKGDGGKEEAWIKEQLMRWKHDVK